LAQRLWRVCPWDPNSPEGHPFSASYVKPVQATGRFDLNGDPPVLNLAQSPAHAVAEKIQAYHGRPMSHSHLAEDGRSLALVEVKVRLRNGSLADLCDPEELARYGVRPNDLMSRHVGCPQSISRRLHDADLHGFRVWSALSGDWHCTVLFMDRVGRNGTLTFGSPVRLHIRHQAVREAAEVLDIHLS
jgi:hypothetical protein